MTGPLREQDWEPLLLSRIEDGKCIPFFGAGACAGVLPLGADIAKAWSKKYRYPLKDRDDLVRVAQFLAVEYDPVFPKEQISKQFKGIAPPDFTQRDEPHALFAELPLPLYMTTNYDDFMMRALSRSRFRAPKADICRWNKVVQNEPSIFELEPSFQPSVATPLVFHIHGNTDIKESIVITEDDYLEFLGEIARNDALLPRIIKRAMMNSAFLFVGYRLGDWNLRVLFQGLPDPGYTSVLVLTPPTGTKQLQDKAQKYFEQYYAGMDLRIYWGTAREFANELRRRRAA